jgi:hypothetical protein
MTQQLKAMIERVKTWPAWRQEDAAYDLPCFFGPFLT